MTASESDLEVTDEHSTRKGSDIALVRLETTTSTRSKIQALRIVRRVVPESGWELSNERAEFAVPADRVAEVQNRLAEAGLLPEPQKPLLQPLATNDWVVVASLMLLALGVRANGLAPPALWLDDAWVGLSARLPWSAIEEVGLTSIGFASLIKVVGGLFGPSPLAFQALPLLFGVTTPALAVVLFRRWLGLWPSATVGLMMALSPVAITFSTRVKQYTFDAFGTTLLIALALHLVERPEEPKRWARFSAAASILVFVSSILLVVVAACCATAAAVVLFRRRQALRQAVQWGAFIGVGTLVFWALVLGPNVNPSVRRYWSGRYVSTDSGITGFARDLEKNIGLAFEAAAPLPTTGWAWTLFALAVVTVAFRRWHVALLCLLPLVVTIVLSALEFAPLGGGRTDTHLMTALFILVGFAVLEWASLLRSLIPAPLPMLRAGLSLALAALAMTSISTSLPYPEQDIRSMVEVLETERQDGDHVLLYYASVWAYALYADVDVELAETDPDLRLSLYNVSFDDEITILGNRRNQPEEYQLFVDRATAAARPVWFISSHHRTDDLDAVSQAFTNAGYVAERTATAPGSQLTRWIPTT